jgi:hypothetical protein
MEPMVVKSENWLGYGPTHYFLTEKCRAKKIATAIQLFINLSPRSSWAAASV